MININDYIEIYTEKELVYQGECHNIINNNYNNITIVVNELFDIGLVTIIIKDKLGETLRTAFIDTSNRVGDITKADKRFTSVYNKIDIILYERTN